MTGSCVAGEGAEGKRAGTRRAKTLIPEMQDAGQVLRQDRRTVQPSGRNAGKELLVYEGTQIRKEIAMTEDDLIIQRLWMERDKLIKENEDLKKENLTLTEQNTELFNSLRHFWDKVAVLEGTLKEEWDIDEIHYCTRCGRPMPDAAWSDEINEYCDICAGDMNGK